MRTVLRAGIVALTCAPLAGCVVVGVDSQGQIVREEKRFSVDGPADLHLATFDGAIEVRATGGSEVIVEIEKRGPTREAVEELRVEGIHTTVPLYRALLADADFLAGRLDIEMLDRKLEAGELRPAAAAENGETPIAAIAAAVEHFSAATSRAGVAGGDDDGAGLRRNGWREQARRDALRSNAWNW